MTGLTAGRVATGNRRDRRRLRGVARVGDPWDSARRVRRLVGQVGLAVSVEPEAIIMRIVRIESSYPETILPPPGPPRLVGKVLSGLGRIANDPTGEDIAASLR